MCSNISEGVMSPRESRRRNSRSLVEMPYERRLGTGVRVGARGADDRLDMFAGGGGEKGQQGVKGLGFDGLEGSNNRNQATGCHSQKSGSLRSVILSLVERGAEGEAIADVAAETADPMTLASQSGEKDAGPSTSSPSSSD